MIVCKIGPVGFLGIGTANLDMCVTKGVIHVRQTRGLYRVQNDQMRFFF